MTSYDVTSICNALIDLHVSCEDSFLSENNIHKGVMHLVDGSAQNEILAKLDGFKLTTTLGGSSLNAMRALAHLGARVAFNGAVGDDKYGEMVKDHMNQLNIRHSLGTSSQEPTGTCLVLVTPDGERTMNTCLGASRLYSHEDINYSFIKESKILHFCGYQWDTANQKDAILKAISVAKGHGVKISFDVADPFVVDRYKSEFLDLIKDSADIVFANQEEAKMLFDSTPAEAASKIADSGAIAVVKVGAKGAIVQNGSSVTTIPAIPTNVVDTTAAGDMFAGGFLYGLTQKKSLEDSGKIASTLASCVISRVGTSVQPETYELVRKI